MAVQPAEALHLIRGYELDALRFTELPAQPAAFLVEDIAQEPWPAHHPCDFRGLSKAHAFRQLVADEAASHHQHTCGRIGLLNDAVGVVDGLKAEALGHLVRAGPGRRLWSATGRDQQRVVRERLAAVRVHDFARCVDLGDPGLQVDLEVLLLVVLDRAHEHLLAPHLAAQVPRQSDPVVQRVLLGGDHDDRGFGVELAQLFRAGLSGDAVADDHVASRQARWADQAYAAYSRHRRPVPRKGWREEERIQRMRDDDPPGPLTQASAPEGRPAV